jgi:hypothetical protein
MTKFLRFDYRPVPQFPGAADMLLVMLFITVLVIMLCKPLWVHSHVSGVPCYTSGWHLFFHVTEVLLIMVF